MQPLLAFILMAMTLCGWVIAWIMMSFINDGPLKLPWKAALGVQATFAASLAIMFLLDPRSEMSLINYLACILGTSLGMTATNLAVEYIRLRKATTTPNAQEENK